jgi:excisionase family DNA binding protein
MLTVADVAERLRKSRSFVYELIGAGRLSYFRVGGSIRVSEAQLTEYLESVERRQVNSPKRRPLPHRKKFSEHLPKFSAD